MKKPRVLIADDEQNIRQLVKRYLDDRYEVLEAADGNEAVSVARKKKPSLVLMDILMPDTDGYEACTLIKNDAELKDTSVVMLTALGFQLNKDLATEIGADGYITKPFTSEQLLKTTRKFARTGLTR